MKINIYQETLYIIQSQKKNGDITKAICDKGFSLNLIKYLLIACLAFMVGCQKNDKDISELILGKWEWKKSVFPYGNQEQNPQTLGFTQTLEFLENGTMNEYKNDTLVKTSDYTIETNPSYPDYYLLNNSTIISGPFDIYHDSLIFNNSFVDGPVSTFIKIK
jgi:hypothetical protein